MSPQPMEDTALILEDVSKSFGPVKAVADVSLRVEAGEVLAFLGPSGCGKSTTLGIVAGFLKADSGSVYCGPRDLTALPPERRDIGMVFQSSALFPHMSVFRNVAFGLRRRKVPTDEIKRRVARAIELVRLKGLEDRLPRELSGGQGQRVSLARALVINPSLLLLDEPMSSLDADLRRELRRDLAVLHQETGTTTVLVTHDQHEALALADQVAVMKDGAIQALGSPQEIVERPSNAFTARFVAEANLFDGIAQEVNGDRLVASVQGGKVGALAAAPMTAGDNVTIAVKPQSFRISRPEDESSPGPVGRIIGIQQLVHRTEIRIELDSETAIVDLQGRRTEYRVGEAVCLEWALTDARAFPAGDVQQ